MRNEKANLGDTFLNGKYPYMSTGTRDVINRDAFDKNKCMVIIHRCCPLNMVAQF